MLKLNQGRSLAVILLAGVLSTACNGGNPLKTQSNPTAEYQDLIESSRPVEEADADQVIPDADNSQYFCGTAFNITVVNDQAARLMTFTEEISSTYTLIVRSNLGDNFEVNSEKSDRPDGSDFKQINNASGSATNIKTFQFSWRPTKADAQKDRTPVVTLRYTSDFVQSKCPTSDVRDSISIAIDSTAQGPSIGISGIPQINSVWGDKFDFTVEVNDPSATQETPPSLSNATFKASVNSGERPASELILNAEDAVQCDRKNAKQKEGTTTWVISCSLDTKKVRDAKANEGKGVTRQASFWFTAKSNRSKQTSDLTGQDILIDFPAPAPAAVSDTTTTPEGAKQ